VIFVEYKIQISTSLLSSVVNTKEEKEELLGIINDLIEGHGIDFLDDDNEFDYICEELAFSDITIHSLRLLLDMDDVVESLREQVSHINDVHSGLDNVDIDAHVWMEDQ